MRWSTLRNPVRVAGRSCSCDKQARTPSRLRTHYSCSTSIPYSVPFLLRKYSIIIIIHTQIHVHCTYTCKCHHKKSKRVNHAWYLYMYTDRSTSMYDNCTKTERVHVRNFIFFTSLHAWCICKNLALISKRHVFRPSMCRHQTPLWLPQKLEWKKLRREDLKNNVKCQSYKFHRKSIKMREIFATLGVSLTIHWIIILIFNITFQQWQDI